MDQSSRGPDPLTMTPPVSMLEVDDVGPSLPTLKDLADHLSASRSIMTFRKLPRKRQGQSSSHSTDNGPQGNSIPPPSPPVFGNMNMRMEDGITPTKRDLTHSPTMRCVVFRPQLWAAYKCGSWFLHTLLYNIEYYCTNTTDNIGGTGAH